MQHLWPLEYCIPTLCRQQCPITQGLSGASLLPYTNSSLSAFDNAMVHRPSARLIHGPGDPGWLKLGPSFSGSPACESTLVRWRARATICLASFFASLSPCSLSLGSRNLGAALGFPNLARCFILVPCPQRPKSADRASRCRCHHLGTFRHNARHLWDSQQRYAPHRITLHRIASGAATEE